MKYVKKREATSAQEGSESPKIEDKVMLQQYPATFEFLTEVVWPDGTTRLPGSLVVFCEDGQFKLCVNDKDCGTVAFIASGTMQGAFQAVELGLRQDTLDWRQSSGGKGKATKRR